MKETIEKLIERIHPDLQQLKDEYFIIGSSALVLSGLPVHSISDLDLLVSKRDADYLKSIWSKKRIINYITENKGLFRSNFGRFDFEEIDVEVMGELEVFKNSRWLPVIVQHAVEIPIEQVRIKIPTLAEQLRIFLLFGREKDMVKVNLIKDFLS